MSKRRGDTFYKVRELMNAGITKTADIAKELGIKPRLVRYHKTNLAKTGFDPKNDRHYHNPEDQVVKGYSTLVRHKDKEDSSTGKIQEWIKTNVSLGNQIESAKEIMDTLLRDIEPMPHIPYQGVMATKNEFTVIPLGDPHIGLRVWEQQTGEHWDIETAKRVYKSVLIRLLSKTPDTEECILVNTGDLFHADNITATSTRSGHHFDMDGTCGMWVDAGMAIMRMIIDACLRKFKKVHYVNVPGNHDDILGRFMGGFVEHVYSENPRLTVDKGDNPFQYVKRGKVLLGFCHGHTAKLPRLPGKMADDQAVLWGQTTYRHWITGHVHHNQWIQFKEHPGCTVESVGIIAPKDAYAHGGAWGAGRTLQSLVFDSKHGESSGRYTVHVRKSD